MPVSTRPREYGAGETGCLKKIKIDISGENVEMNKKLKIALLSVIGFVICLVVLSSVGGTMTELNHQIKINAPAEKAFAVLSNLESVQHYNPGVLSAKYVGDSRNGVGAARECDLGKDGKVRERVTEYKQNEYISMELYQHNWPLEFMKWKTRVQPSDGGAVISQTMQYKMKFGLLGSVLDGLFMKKKLDSTLNSVFSSMKDYIEKQ